MRAQSGFKALILKFNSKISGDVTCIASMNLFMPLEDRVGDPGETKGSEP